MPDCDRLSGYTGKFVTDFESVTVGDSQNHQCIPGFELQLHVKPHEEHHRQRIVNTAPHNESWAILKIS